FADHHISAAGGAEKPANPEVRPALPVFLWLGLLGRLFLLSLLSPYPLERQYPLLLLIWERLLPRFFVKEELQRVAFQTVNPGQSPSLIWLQTLDLNGLVKPEVNDGRRLAGVNLDDRKLGPRNHLFFLPVTSEGEVQLESCLVALNHELAQFLELL